jgi:hypothetical protein
LCLLNTTPWKHSPVGPTVKPGLEQFCSALALTHWRCCGESRLLNPSAHRQRASSAGLPSDSGATVGPVDGAAVGEPVGDTDGAADGSVVGGSVAAVSLGRRMYAVYAVGVSAAAATHWPARTPPHVTRAQGLSAQGVVPHEVAFDGRVPRCRVLTEVSHPASATTIGVNTPVLLSKTCFTHSTSRVRWPPAAPSPASQMASHGLQLPTRHSNESQGLALHNWQV